MGLENLKSLRFLSLNKTNISNIPEAISHLDVTNGGSLSFISIDDNDKLHQQISRYLPNTNIITNKKLISNEKIQSS